jgi:nitrate reductase gamma subunit
MHVAFALMIGIPAAKIVRPVALKVAWGLYPVFVTFVVIVTANHWWLDAVLGAAVAAVAAVAASEAFGRARPEAWAWRTPALGAKAAA